MLFFPPEEREVAISVFGASGALANGKSHFFYLARSLSERLTTFLFVNASAAVLGVVIGGILLLASWDWCVAPLSV